MSIGKEEIAKIVESIDAALKSNKLDQVIEIIAKVKTDPEIDKISQAFLLKKGYNFKTKFTDMADFKQFMDFSNALNRR